ncbi:hypothetical protein KFL_001100210 [Klebsormidium nitens]|uniref:Uncharacterized protein n=1 Tax=Klebsormidium nitens TaxID=105231 RepID=A0A1Y1I0U5_KLENI|nr:hypothetical protein KFL_001100210 [Klebsormidium nitens]|eukprot:GAQ82407.1 hypothetical protein KFL_001100210 [Klebsormidium nitens]
MQVAAPAVSAAQPVGVAPPIIAASEGGSRAGIDATPMQPGGTARAEASQPALASNVDKTNGAVSSQPALTPPAVANAMQAPPGAEASANSADVVRLYTNAAEAAKSSSLQAGAKFPTIPPAPQPTSVLSSINDWAHHPPPPPQLDTRSPLEKRGWLPPPVHVQAPASLPGGDQPFRFPKVPPPPLPPGQVPVQEGPPPAKRGRPRKDKTSGALPAPEIPTVVGGQNLGWPATEQPPPPAPLPHLGGLGALPQAAAGVQPQIANVGPQQAMPAHATPPQQSSLPNVLFAEWYIQRLGWLANALMNRPRPKEEVRDVPCGIFLTALENDGILRVQNDLNLKSFSHVVGAIGSGTLLDDILRSHTAIVVDMLQRQEAERKEALELMTRAQEKIAHLEMELRTATYKLASEQEVTKRLMNALKSVQGAGLTDAQQTALGSQSNLLDNPGLKRGYTGASGVVEIVDLDPEVVGAKWGRGRPRKDDPTAKMVTLPRVPGLVANPVANRTLPSSASPASNVAPVATTAAPGVTAPGTQSAAAPPGVSPPQNTPPKSAEQTNPQTVPSLPISSAPTIAPPATVSIQPQPPVLPPTTSGGLLSLAPAPPLFKPVAPSITSAALANIAPVPPFTGIPPPSPFELPERTSIALSNGRGARTTSFFEVPERLTVEEAARRASLPGVFAVPEKTTVEEATRAAMSERPAPLTEEALGALRAGFVLPERVSLSGRPKSGSVKSAGGDVEMRDAKSVPGGGDEQAQKEGGDTEMAEAGEGDVAPAPAGNNPEDTSGAKLPEIGLAPGESENVPAVGSNPRAVGVGDAAEAGGVLSSAEARGVLFSAEANEADEAKDAVAENKASPMESGRGEAAAKEAETPMLDDAEEIDALEGPVESAEEKTRRGQAQKEDERSPEKSTGRPPEAALTPLRRSGRHK